MSAAQLKIPCLGRNFSLGLLYDCRNERLLDYPELWDSKALESATKKDVKSKSSHEIYVEDTIKMKCQVLDIANNQLKLSLFSGLVEVDGAALYWNDEKKCEKCQSRVTFHFKSTSRIEKLMMEKLGSVQALQGLEATHVVTEITYGADALFVFDREVNEGEDLKKISNGMAAQIKNLGKEGHFNRENYDCTYFGDFDLSTTPSTFDEAVATFSELQHLQKHHCVTKTATLLPLSKVKGLQGIPPYHMPKSSAVEEMMESFRSVKLRANDLKHHDICCKFEKLGKQIENFVQMVECFQCELKNKLSTLLPEARTTKANEKALSEMISSVNKSPYSLKNMNNYIKNKEREMDKLSDFNEKLKKIKLVFDLPSSGGNLESLIRDSQQIIVCFAFNTVSDISTYIENLETYKDAEDLTALSTETREWFTKPDSLDNKLTQFIEFAKVNQNSENVVFVVTDQNDEVDSSDPVIILYKNGAPAIFQPPSIPRAPTAIAITSNSVKVRWNIPDLGASSITSYRVNYYYKDVSHRQQVATKNNSDPTIVIDALIPGMEYTCTVQAVSEAGLSPESSKIKVKPEIRIADVMRKNAKRVHSKNHLELYQLKKKTLHANPTDRSFKYELGTRPSHVKRSDKVLMVVGATGAGKSTMINGIANYAYGIKWDDDFRFMIIPEAPRQDMSQTKDISAYILHSTVLPYSLTIVDTPGFGDTGGIERDKEIAANVKKFFSETNRGGIDHLDGIGFVVQASLPRLTPTQKYIFEAVLAIFGNDIIDNIFLLCTFADAGTPKVLAATQAAQIPYKESFKFNSSALFASNTEGLPESEFNCLQWKMGVSSFKNFFIDLSKAEPRSLTLTREVLAEREAHETLIIGLQQQVRVGLDQLNQLQQEEQILKQREAEINANENFTYEIDVTKFEQISLEGTGRNKTTCRLCTFTCHDDCIYPDNSQKKKCSAMSSDGQCKVCPKKCV